MRKLSNDELNRLSATEFRACDKLPFIVVLDNVRSLYNVGSVFRTADAFLCEAIYLCGITACPPNKEIHKTALGAEETVKWQYFDDTAVAVQQLKADGWQIVAIEQAENSISLQSFKVDRSAKYAFVFGHEVKGVCQEVMDCCDVCLEIPQFGTKHSLNISVSAGIVLWEIGKYSLVE